VPAHGRDLSAAVPQQGPILYTSRRTAELIKYTANAFLATKIAFINEIADLAEEVGADVQEIARGIGLDNRIGTKFLHPGPGFGGSCFPKDTRALLQTAHDYEVPLRIVEAVITANDMRKRAMARKVAAAFGGSLRGKIIAVLGLTFKPNTDDMREAPSIPLITALQDMGAKVRVFDPAGMEQAKGALTEVTYSDGPYACAEGADGLVIVTEWEQFRGLDLAQMKQRMACPILVDLRNIYSNEESASTASTMSGLEDRLLASAIDFEHFSYLYSEGITKRPGRQIAQPGIEAFHCIINVWPVACDYEGHAL
jgi:UDPglucose 6-dehydrogenase